MLKWFAGKSASVGSAVLWVRVSFGLHRSAFCLLPSVFILLPSAFILLLSSCSQPTMKASKEEAQERWGQVRGRLKAQMAADSVARGDLDQAHRYVDEAIGLDPATPDNYVLLAKILLEQGETASAAQALEEALRRGGDTAEMDYLRGVVADRYGRFAEALGWYQRASQREPANAHYVATVAETLVALDRPAEALALVRERSTDFEQNATLRALAGGIYMMLGRYEEAVNAYRQAVQIAPDDETLRFQLGLALTFSKSYAEGKTVLEKAAASKDVAPCVLVALGRCHMGLNEHEEAKRVLQRAVAASPDNARAWSWLARAASASGDLLTARRAASQAAQIEPDNPEYAMLLGYVCWRQQDYAQAAVVLEKVVGSSPDELIGLYLLSQCYEAMGNAKAARDCGQRALGVDPNCEWAKRLLEEKSVSVSPEQAESSLAAGSVRSP